MRRNRPQTIAHFRGVQTRLRPEIESSARARVTIHSRVSNFGQSFPWFGTSLAKAEFVWEGFRDQKLETEGKTDKAVGKVQNAA